MKYTNTKQVPRVTPETSGAVYVDRQKYDLANAPTLANGDLVQVAVVPAGSVLIPHLTRISVPILDSNGTATGKYDLGTEATADALATNKGAGAAVVLGVGDLPDVAIGSQTADTPIYLKLTTGLATQAATGTVQSDLAVRAFDTAVD